MSRQAFRSRRVVLPEGERAAAVVVDGERIAAIVACEDAPADAVDVSPLAILPGLVDPHVHCNDPGRTEWETFPDATRAAAAGGITTLVDMPLNCSPVTTHVSHLAAKLEAAGGRIHVDVGFHAGLVAGNADQIAAMIDAGALGVKAFLCHSGIDEFPSASEADLRAAMRVCAERGVPLLAHCELVEEGFAPGGDPRRYATWLASRPAEWEVRAIELMIRLCRETGCATHIVHLSAADALEMIAAARAEGLPLTVETCPHYLAFAAEEIPDGATLFKCAPPIRGRDNRERLWDALRAAVIDLVASDHSPSSPELKKLAEGDFMAAWGGIASLQLLLPAVWTGARERGLGLGDVVRWLSDAPAAMMGLSPRKGGLRVGADADLVFFDPDAPFTVDPARLFHRHPLTPYAGRELTGVVRRTMLRGRTIFEDGAPAGAPAGTTLLKGWLG